MNKIVKSRNLLEESFDNFEKIAIVTSFQAGGIVTLHLSKKINPLVRVYTLDTNMLPKETYDYISTISNFFDLDLTVVYPNEEEVHNMVKEHGLELFYDSKEKRELCCNTRKVKPFKQIISKLDAWISGIHKDQSAARSIAESVEHQDAGVIKINPVADWTLNELISYIKQNNIPIHPLYERNFLSIGCLPCTRAVKYEKGVRAQQRSGRWWWEDDPGVECGIHNYYKMGLKKNKKT